MLGEQRVGLRAYRMPELVLGEILRCQPLGKQGFQFFLRASKSLVEPGAVVRA